jgi:regulator of sigma E protease
MSILILIISLAVLIFVHELGHFLIAKLFNIRVDEFALGFPPTLFKYTKGETTYKLNLVPFGGYVKIFGENYETAGEEPRSFVRKTWWQQILVLIAGVIFNIVLTWMLFAIIYTSGVIKTIEPDQASLRGESSVTILEVLSESPAERAGIIPGSKILQIDGIDITHHESLDIKTVDPLMVTLQVNGEVQEVLVTPEFNSELDRAILGVSLETFGIVREPIHQAVWQGLKDAGTITVEIAKSLGFLIRDAFKGDAELNTLTGPVGLVGVVDDAGKSGFTSVLALIAIISLNLAVINLVPFPALDGGRILFVLIEKIKGSPINPNVALWLNGIGFVLLIGLMIAVTVSDVLKLV